MMTRLVVTILGVIGLAGVIRADEPARPVSAAELFETFGTFASPASEKEKARPPATLKPRSPKPEATGGPAAAAVDEAARRFGVTVDELKQLRQLGFADSEIAAQLSDGKRTARQIITERAVIDDLARALAQVNARVYKLSVSEQNTERERAMKAALARTRRDHHASRDDLRRILAGTSLLTPEETRHLLGPGLFDTDTIRRVGATLFGEGQDQEESPR
jgi:hypothetical protein